MEIADSSFENLVAALAELDEVEALALGGSRGSDTYDEKSDYDLYVYVSRIPSKAVRRKLLEKFCSYMEIGNAFWELEDDCTLNNGIDIDILYRNLDDFSHAIENVVDECNAYNGYTTCMWHNLLHSRILFDRNGRLKALQEKYSIGYPEDLRQAIISRNMRLLTGNLPSYDRQIAKAMERGDLVSVNHRLSAYLESYFDVLFALNRLTHPGEKRMKSYALAHADLLPEHFEEDLQTLFDELFSDMPKGLGVIVQMKQRLEALVSQNSGK